jgi:molybdopterin-guanine dinucleotide biosynthesis protein A
VERAAGVVLAGGRSRRIGTDKARLPFGDTTLLRHVVRRVAAACAPVCVVASSSDAYPKLGVPVVTDRVPGRGPLEGLAVGLRHVPTPCAAVVACDLPFVNPALLRGLVTRLGTADAAVPYTDRPQPLCAVYRREVFHLAATLAEEGASLQELLRRLRVRFLGPEALRAWDPDLASFWNVNTPEDYARAVEALAREGQRTRPSPL